MSMNFLTSTNVHSVAAGEYILEVRSVANSRVALRSEPIKVVPAPMKQAEIGKLFDDLDDMLKF